MLDAVWILGGYLAGSVPFGYLWVNFSLGQDIRTLGSGNIGATNVGRVAGKFAGACVFALDVIKGWGPAWTYGRWAGANESPWTAIGVGLAALAGHCFPAWLSFKGGKGVATGFGVLLALFPLAGALTLAVWSLSAVLTRYVSVSSILAALSLPLWLALGLSGLEGRRGGAWMVFAILAGGAVVLRHAGNIKRLMAGTEPKMGRKNTGDRRQETQ